MIAFLPWLLMPVFVLGQLDRFNLIASEVVLHINDAVVLLCVLAGVVSLRSKFGQTLRRDPLSKPLGIWMLAVLISLVVNSFHLTPHQVIVASLYAFRWLIYSGLYFVLRSMSKKDRRLFRPWLLSVGLFVALTGLMQYALLPNVAYLAAHNWDDHYYRLVGVFLDPGFTGAILCLSLFLCLDYFFRSTRLGVLAAVTILYTALALTYSRASYLMYLVALIVLTLWRKSVKIFVIGAVLLLITVYVLPHNSSEGTHLARENSVLARLHNWQHSIVIWQKAPIFGVGFDAYRYTQPVNINSHAGAGADSSLLLVLAATGIIGFLCYVNLVRKMLSIGRNDWLFIASFLAILVHSFFNNTLFYPWVMEWLWILLATTNESS